ncbi:MAG: CRTAC1 family protein [Phycisphaerales bacterium]
MMLIHVTTFGRFVAGLTIMPAVFAGSFRAAAQTELPFTSEAGARGVSYLPEDSRSFGCGFACVDLNNDGAPDLVLLGKQSVSAQSPYTIGVYQNSGAGVFTNRSTNNGIPSRRAAAGVSSADFDNDGDLDLLITCWLQANILLRNLGNFQFEDVTAAFAMGIEAAGQSSAWGDVNGDGWLDIYVANRTTTNYPAPPFPQNLVKNLFYINNQGQSFTEMAVPMGIDAGLDPSFQSSFFDFDRDGDPDLYLSNDKGASQACAIRNRMWRNDNGQFVDISAASGTNGCIDAMCLTFGDFDHNRHPDMYITNVGGGNAPNYLYMNQGDGTFIDRAAASGTSDGQLAWGSVFFDYNNDGFDDLYVCHSSSPNKMFRNIDGQVAVEVAGEMNVADPAESFTCAVADLDNDGDLDLMVSNRTGTLPPSFKMFINHEGERRHWMKFRVVGRGANRFAVGAQIDLRVGSTWQWREVVAGSNFKNQNDLMQHFGMNDAVKADEIIVRWPRMDGQVVQRTLRGYPANRTWVIYPPEKLGDANQDGLLDSTDFFACLTCIADSGGVIGPSCEVFDMDGSGAFDSLDFFAFLHEFFAR